MMRVFVLSSAPEASPVARWARDAERRIGPRRTEKCLERAAGNGQKSGAPQILLGRFGDALTSLVCLVCLNTVSFGTVAPNLSSL
jgi:hypothetical protein